MQIEYYNFKIENYSGVKTYWSVQNNHAIKHNKKKEIQEIKSLQFLPLIYPPYIRIFCITNWNHGGKKLGGSSRYSAIWTNTQQKHRLSLNKTSSKLAINYLLDNCYFPLGSMCLIELSEIPIWSDPAPLWQTYFYIIIKESGFFKQKYRICVKLASFQLFYIIL